MIHQFKLAIGDWSGDGHYQSETFLVNSTKSAGEVQEAYWKAADMLGYRLEGHNRAMAPCTDYENGALTQQQLEQYTIDGIFTVADLPNKPYKGELNLYMDADSICKLVLNFMMKGDSDLLLEVAAENLVPTLPAGGYDSEGRHMGQFGYGIYSR